MTEIEQCRNAIKEYRKGYRQTQLKDDCIIQLMIGHHKSRVNAISDEIKINIYTELIEDIKPIHPEYIVEHIQEQISILKHGI